MDSIYLDHNAATPIHSKVVDAMVRCQGEIYANPASQHRPGQRAKAVLEDAREKVAEILGADLSPPSGDRLIFTSGGTEANNLAVLGIALAGGGVPGRIVISAGEHQSVIGPAEHLLEHDWRLDTLGLTPQGVVRVDQLAPLLTGETRLVSVLMGNHETGVLQPIAELASICARAGVSLHTDAVQVVGKMPVNFRELGVAAMTVSAHKFRGPVGIGALVVRGDIPLAPLLFGGHQQSAMRPGTEPVALAVGMAVALELSRQDQQGHATRLRSLRDRFERALRTALPGVVVHGAAAPRLPQTSNLAFPGLDAEVLRIALDLAGVACSVGSACSSGSTELSPTLRAMDMPKELVASSLRFSVGETTTEAEVDEAVRRIAAVCGQLHVSR
jgi:cysteine desulfurase